MPSELASAGRLQRFLRFAKSVLGRAYSQEWNRIFFALSSFVARLDSSSEENFFQKVDLNRRTVYDIGAYIGTKTVFFAKKVGLEGKVVAFEPNPASFSQLVSNIARNHLGNVTALNIALGSRRQEGLLVASAYSTATGSIDSQVQQVLKRSSCKEWKIQIKTLDALIERLPLPDFVKIDVEGYEYEVLQGMTKTILSCKPIICVEIHGLDIKMKKANVQRIMQRLDSFGYEFAHLETKRRIFLNQQKPLKGHILAFQRRSVARTQIHSGILRDEQL